MIGKPRILRRAATATPLPDNLHPVLKRIYAQRGIAAARELESSSSRLLACEGLSGVEAAVALLTQALEQAQRILVIGDFDADGATSTALALRALRAFGAGDVHYLVPNRFEYGYGLTPEIVAEGAKIAPQLLITVDNGISSVEGVAGARAAGMRVLVTDHHLPGQQLPAADAIVNPSLRDCLFPSKCLAGVGVIFYVLLALRKRLRETGWFALRALPEPNMGAYLDLVALGTVADVVPLDQNNRILVEQGLRRIRAGRCIPGIEILLEVSGRDPRRAIASDLAFSVGPRLNAAGRLQDMSLGIECLLNDDRQRVMTLAKRLDDLNRQRREIEERMHNQAVLALQAVEARLGQDKLPFGLCLFDKDWHQGIIGILAARIKDRFHRPVIAFADAGEAMLKGSARSVAGLHVRDVLEAVALRHPGLISRFGGHAMAAGLSLPAAHLDAFRAAFDRMVRATISPDQLSGAVYTDGELSEADFTLELARLLRSAGPWGQGFPEPVFDGVFEIVDRRVVAERHLKLRVRPDGGTGLLDAMVFNHKASDWRHDLEYARLVYRFEEDEYQGSARALLIVTHAQPT